MMSQCGVVHIIVLPQKTRQPLSNLTKGIVKVSHELGGTRPKESNLVESHIGYPESFFFSHLKKILLSRCRCAGLCLPSSLVGCLKESELKYKRHLEASPVLKELNVSSMRKNTVDIIHLYLWQGRGRGRRGVWYADSSAQSMAHHNQKNHLISKEVK